MNQRFEHLVQNDSVKSAVKVIEEVEADGWELVCVTKYGETILPTTTLFFKRLVK